MLSPGKMFSVYVPCPFNDVRTAEFFKSFAYLKVMPICRKTLSFCGSQDLKHPTIMASLYAVRPRSLRVLATGSYFSIFSLLFSLKTIMVFSKGTAMSMMCVTFPELLSIIILGRSLEFLNVLFILISRWGHLSRAFTILSWTALCRCCQAADSSQGFCLSNQIALGFSMPFYAAPAMGAFVD